MSDRFYDSKANRDRLDNWLTRDPFEPYTGAGEPPPDPALMWVVDLLLQHWTESLPVVLETLEEMSAPEPVLAAVRRLRDSPQGPDNDPQFRRTV